MKKMIFLVLVVCGLGYSQQLAVDSSYSATDTTGWASIGNGNKVLVFEADDSCNVTIVADYRSANAAATVFQSYTVVSDSTNSTNASGFFKGYVLRFGGTNNIPGAEKIRLRVTPKTTGNGTTSPTYSAYIKEF